MDPLLLAVLVLDSVALAVLGCLMFRRELLRAARRARSAEAVQRGQALQRTAAPPDPLATFTGPPRLVVVDADADEEPL